MIQMPRFEIEMFSISLSASEKQFSTPENKKGDSQNQNNCNNWYPSCKGKIALVSWLKRRMVQSGNREIPASSHQN